MMFNQLKNSLCVLSLSLLLVICSILPGEAASIYATENILTGAKLISASSFKNTDIFFRPSTASVYAELPSPNARNQFLIFDLQRPLNMTTANISIPAEYAVPTEDITVYSGTNILQWQKISGMIENRSGTYTAPLLPNNGQYLKFVFGTATRNIPLKIKSIEVLGTDFTTTQDILDITALEEKITSTSAVITYRTAQPSLTYVLYGANFDFLYSNKLENVYYELTPRTEHQAILSDLLPKATYVYQVLAKDANGKEYRTGFLYFSTK